MSRATVDLQSVRFFLGYGLIFIAQSLVTILLAAVAMFCSSRTSRRSRWRRCRSSSSSPTATASGRVRRMQEAQQRIAELTAEAEENVSGVRVVKAFAQERRQLSRFRNRCSACSTSRCWRSGSRPSTTR